MLPGAVGVDLDDRVEVGVPEHAVPEDHAADAVRHEGIEYAPGTGRAESLAEVRDDGVARRDDEQMRQSDKPLLFNGQEVVPVVLDVEAADAFDGISSAGRARLSVSS